jgi:hypothetical protein
MFIEVVPFTFARAAFKYVNVNARALLIVGPLAWPHRAQLTIIFQGVNVRMRLHSVRGHVML